MKTQTRTILVVLLVPVAWIASFAASLHIPWDAADPYGALLPAWALVPAAVSLCSTAILSRVWLRRSPRLWVVILSYPILVCGVYILCLGLTFQTDSFAVPGIASLALATLVCYLGCIVLARSSPQNSKDCGQEGSIAAQPRSTGDGQTRA